jgi:hypothetical protein
LDDAAKMHALAVHREMQLLAEETAQLQTVLREFAP